MDALNSTNNFWTKDITDREAGEALVAMASRYKPHQESRKRLSLKYACLFENLSLSSFAAHGYTNDASVYFKVGNTEVPIIKNQAFSIIDTLTSFIGALDPPKPTFMTSEGDWSDKRKAEKLRKLVEAGYKEKQGLHQNTYKLCQHALKIAAAATGTVAVKVCVYPNQTRVTKEIHDTLDMFLDVGDMTYGDILSLGETTWLDPDYVISMFPDYATEIRGAAVEPPYDKNVAANLGYVKKLVPLHEGWRVTVGDVVGRYVCALPSGLCLINDEYDYPTVPFAFLRVNPHLNGPFGHSITHYVFESVLRSNMITGTADRSVMRTPRSRTYAVKNNINNPADLERIDDAQVVWVDDMGQVPADVAPLGYHPGHLDLANQHSQDAYDISGVSEARAGAKAENAITSAIGQRNVVALTAKRFAELQTAYIEFVAVDIAHLEIRAMKEVFERDGKFTKKWAGSKWLQTIDADVLDLDNDSYTISGEAVSGIKNTPADRVQKAYEFYSAGAISADTYASTTEDYDTPEVIDEENAESEWIHDQMYKWTFANDSELDDPDFYQSPLKFIDLNLALTTVIQGIMRAQIDKLEPNRIEYFLRFLSDIDALITARAVYARSLQEGQPPGGPPPGGNPTPQPPAQLTS